MPPDRRRSVAAADAAVALRSAERAVCAGRLHEAERRCDRAAEHLARATAALSPEEEEAARLDLEARLRAFVESEREAQREAQGDAQRDAQGDDR